MPVTHGSLVRRAVAGAAALCVAAGCTGKTPPPASFLVVAGDSTFWVEQGGERLRMRASPLFLVRLGGEFSELYIADDDRSYRDALIVGQRIYRRDLVTGDSILLREDSTIAGLAAQWQSTYPNDVPLGPDEETEEEPSTVATTETQLLDVVGPYLSFEYHLDVDVNGHKDQHLTQRGVIDVRTGRQVRVEELVDAAAASRMYAEGAAALREAIDSIRKARDERAVRARSTIGGFRFDSTSFELLEGERSPEVAFLVPGRGPTAGGYALPLPSTPMPPPPWWSELRGTSPDVVNDALLAWSGQAYDIVVRTDPTSDRAALEVRRGRRTWPVATIPQPVRRVHRLDAASDSSTRQALARAFDDAAGYSGDARTASLTHPHATRRSTASLAGSATRSARGVIRTFHFLSALSWNPGRRATPKQS